MPCISVVVPMYNKKNSIGATLKAVRQQGYSKYEIIIVDDGSCDGSIEIVRSFGGDNIRVISQKNGGVSRARNVGFKEASFEYVAFLDADDLWDSKYLSEIANIITEYGDVAEIFCGSLSVFRDGKITKVYKSTHKSTGLLDYLDYIDTGGVISSSSVVISKNLLNEINGFRVGYPVAEDVDTWIRAGSISKIAFSNKAKAYYVLNQVDIDRKMRNAEVMDLPLFSTYNELSNATLKKFVSQNINAFCLKQISRGAVVSAMSIKKQMVKYNLQPESDLLWMKTIVNLFPKFALLAYKIKLLVLARFGRKYCKIII